MLRDSHDKGAESIAGTVDAGINSGRKPSMFESARFKLTLFYLAIIVFLSLSLTIGTRWLAQYEYERSNVAQRGAFRGVITRMYGELRPDDDIFGFQHREEQAVRARLNLYVLLINVGALVFGGVASWWFAGRTLRPIEEAHDAQKRFASDASHELKTPLTVIKTENEVFLRQKSFRESDARELIQSNLEEVDRLERLATNLLALTHYESAALELEAIDITDIVSDTSRAIERTHPSVRILQKLEPSLVLGNRPSLVQLIMIILDNAWKYGGDDIELDGVLNGSEYTVHIRDHGPGISTDDLPHIFERLYRGDKSRSGQQGGHGLGLALAKQIARANNAVLSAMNHKDGGAVFIVKLQAASKKK